MTNKKPAHEIRLGMLKASIWENKFDKGTLYNVAFSRAYKDANGEWKRAESFGRDDLLLLAKIADRAHSWICDQSTPRQHENS